MSETPANKGDYQESEAVGRSYYTLPESIYFLNKKKYNQSEIALKLGITQAYVSKVLKKWKQRGYQIRKFTNARFFEVPKQKIDSIPPRNDRPHDSYYRHRGVQDEC